MIRARQPYASATGATVQQQQHHHHLHALSLSCVRVRPTWLSQTSQAIATLNGIERVQVASARKDLNGNASGSSDAKGRAFWVEAYEQATSTSHIPTNQTSRSARHQSSAHAQQPAANTHPAPVARVARSQAEFALLRRKMYFIARDAHIAHACAFCEQVVYEAVGGGGTNPNRLMSLLLGDAKVAQRLNRFVNNLLELTKCVSPAKGERRCAGQDSIPLLLCEFLTYSSAQQQQHHQHQHEHDQQQDPDRSDDEDAAPHHAAWA